MLTKIISMRLILFYILLSYASFAIAQFTPSFSTYLQLNSNKKNYGPSSEQKEGTWTEYHSTGFTKYKKRADGSLYAKAYVLCINCRGTRLCPVCSGLKKCVACRGRGTIVIGNYYNPCMCIAGMCKTCKGKGVCLTCDPEHPGYTFSRDMIITPDGNVYRSREYEHSTASDNSNRNSGNKGACANCGGSGVDPSGLATSMDIHVHHRGQKAPTMSGEKCQYCTRIDCHYHLYCPHCEKGARMY